MYNLPYFKEKDKDKVLSFIKAHPFAFICGADKEGNPVASQIPVFVDEIDGELFLSGHLMRQTDHHKAFLENDKVLCVFTGAHSYVSATWYSDPHQASTWNYMSVHARGTIEFLGENELIEVLKRTTLHFEKGNKDSTTVFENLSEEYRNKLLPAIVAFRVKVTKLDNVFKLSQNRDKESYGNIINELSSQDHEGKVLANEMKNRETELYD